MTHVGAASKRALIQTRQAKAWELRLAGLSIPAIAKQLNAVPRTIQDDLETTFAELKAKRITDIETWRDIEIARLDDLQVKTTTILLQAKNPTIQLKALNQLLAISAERRKLLGLDAPTKHELSGPDGQPLFPLFTQFMMVAAQAGYKPEELLKMLVAEIDPTGPSLVIETVAKETE